MAETQDGDDVIYLDTNDFAKAVEQALIAAKTGKDGYGRAVMVTVSPFRMAVAIREAIAETIGDVTRCRIEVKDWLNLIQTMKVPFPGARPPEDDDGA